MILYKTPMDQNPMNEPKRSAKDATIATKKN
jgi:hypothetical protein